MENVVSKEQMESLKALSDVNIKISEARNLLFQLQENETEYLVVREKKALDRIQKIVDESGEMVKEIDKNYFQIKELSTGINDFVTNLLKIQDTFKLALEDFENRNVEWERNIGKQQDDITDTKKTLNLLSIQIQNDKQSLESARKKLEEDQRKLNSDRETLQRNINRFK